MSTIQKYQITESTMKKMNSQTLRELRDIAKKHKSCFYYKLTNADFIIRTFDSGEAIRTIDLRNTNTTAK